MTAIIRAHKIQMPQQNINLSLRDVVESDLPILSAQCYDIDTFDVPASKSEYYRYMETYLPRYMNAFKEDTVIKKTILVDDQVLGAIFCQKWNLEPEVSYWVDRSNWGKGIATRALGEFLKIFPLRPLYARVDSWNTASLRVLQKNGFIILTGVQYFNMQEDEFFLHIEG